MKRGIFCYCCPGQFSRRENDLVTYFVTRNPDECQKTFKSFRTSIWDYLRVYIQSGDVSQSLLALNKWADFKVGRIHQFTTPYCFCVCFKHQEQKHSIVQSLKVQKTKKRKEGVEPRKLLQIVVGPKFSGKDTHWDKSWKLPFFMVFWILDQQLSIL